MNALERPIGSLPSEGTWRIDEKHSSISFTVVHVIGRVRGEFRSFSGEVIVGNSAEHCSASIYIESRSLDTHVARRDTHVLASDFLDADGFPHIKYRSLEIRQAALDDWIMFGNLTMHGVTNPVAVGFRYRGTAMDGENLIAGFSGTAEVDRFAFGLSYQRLLENGVGAIGRNVRVDLDIAVLKKVAHGD